MKSCTVEGCTRRYGAKGLCIMHYNRRLRTGDPTKAQRMVPRGSSVEERLELLTDRTAGPDGCHLWTGTIHHTGYGVMQYDGITMGAHVWAFLEAGGQLSFEEPCVLHSCDTRACVNPRHLRAGSVQANMDDKVNRGRQWRGGNAPRVASVTS